MLSDLGDDPNWGGEYLIDISTPEKRQLAFEHVAPMIDACGERGFDAVEFDNLDSWTRFDETPLAGQVPFGRRAAVRYAELLTDHAHQVGLAVGQKNTTQLSRRTSLRVVGFDFAIAEECGFYHECADYVAVFGDRVIVIEYTRRGFRAACRQFGDRLAIMRRDVLLQTPSSPDYRYRAC